jgi:hypothetical protein
VEVEVAQGKITPEELDKRVMLAVKLLAKGTIKSDIKKAMQDKFNVGPRAVEDYLSRARAVLREDAAGEIEDHRAEAAAWYRSVLLNDSVNMQAKIKARRGMDDLLGLVGPRVVVGIQNTNVHAGAGADDVADALFMKMTDACNTEDELRNLIGVFQRVEQMESGAPLLSASAVST